MILQKLGLYFFVEQNIGQAEVVDVHEAFRNEVIQRRHFVKHDARHSEQCRLEDNRAARRRRAIRNRHQIVTMLADEFHFDSAPCDCSRERDSIDAVRRRQEEFYVRSPFRDQARGFEHRLQQEFDLLPTTAGHQQDHMIFRSNIKKTPRGVLRHRRLDGVDHRIADECDVGSRLPIHFDLERKDRRELIGNRRAIFRAPLAPCPCRRRDVREDFYAECFRAFCEPPIEVRIIDQHQNIGTLALHALRQFVKQLKNAPEIFDHFPDAHDAEVFAIADEPNARRRHSIAAEAEQFDRRINHQNLAGNCRAVNIAGHFSGRKHYLHYSIRNA